MIIILIILAFIGVTRRIGNGVDQIAQRHQQGGMIGVGQGQRADFGGVVRQLLFQLFVHGGGFLCLLLSDVECARFAGVKP